MIRTLAIVALLGCVTGTARGGDPPPAAAPPAATPAPPPPEQVADSVLAAVRAKDDTALKVLATRDDPDPWLVADALLVRGETDAADAFARAVPRVDTEALPAYVAAQRGKPDDAARRARLAAANAALAGGKPKDALDAVGPPDTEAPVDVVGIRRGLVRGSALAAVGRLEESASAFFVVADAAQRLGWLAIAARALGEAVAATGLGSDNARALVAGERLRVLAEARGDRVGAARALVDLGTVHDVLGDYATALECYARALHAMEDLKDREGAARTLGSVGNVHFALGNYPEALECYARALNALEDLGDLAGVALTLGNAGNVHSALGNYRKALENHERALRMKEEAGNRAGMAVTLGNLGNVHGMLGNYAKALEYQERALKGSEEAGDRAAVTSTLVNIGNVHEALGNHPQALRFFERALKRMEEVGNRAGAALALGSVGTAHESLGNHAKALEHYERALRMMEESGDRAGAATALGNIGLVHQRLGDQAKAIAALERAVRAAEKLRANELLSWELECLARARLRSGDARRAIEAAHRAVSLLERILGGLGEEQGATARGQYAGVFSVGLVAAARAQDAPEAAFFLESGRAGTLLESLGSREALRWAGLPEELRTAEAEARAHEARALVAYTKALDAGERDAIRVRDEELTAARARVQEVVERIQRDAKKEAHLWYPVASPIEDIQGLLEPGEVLVLYGLAKDDDAHVLVLTREEARIVGLGKSAEVEAACEALSASDPAGEPVEALDRLRNLLIKPLALPKATKLLLVSPEGPLSYVPFSALVPELAVACEPSGTTYGVLLEERGKRGEQVLALADPDYGAAYNPTAMDLYVPTRGGRLVPLPGTREEAKAVADVSLFGKDASEAGLREALAKKKGRWHGVHFACHGLVDPERPTLSSLVLTPDARNDGFLTALEVLRMEIPADLVVLSACETGKGKVVTGEGIVGLTRAFMYAGSPRVLCSLWKVDDEATRALMTKFYEMWNPKTGSAGVGAAEALRQAQEFVRSQEKWKHPYFWAAWVLWGLPS